MVDLTLAAEVAPTHDLPPGLVIVGGIVLIAAAVAAVLLTRARRTGKDQEESFFE